MTKITIGKSAAGQPVTLDVGRLIVSKLLVTASSGGGKSWLLRKVLEGVSEKTQTIVIDVEGEFATLREKRDMVLAGPAGEVPAEARSAGLLCRRLMELNLSAVIDVSELKPSDKRRFVSLFCNTLVELPRSLWRPCFVCIDETHEFAPEGERSESTDAVALLGSKGRKRGYCLLAATQRISKLNKDVAAELKNQFVGQMQLDVDLRRAADMLGFGKDRWPELRDLSPPEQEGEFFCFGPAMNARGVTKMRAGQVETTHPKAGQGRLSAPPAASAKIKGVLGELTDLAAKADEEAKTLADAKKQIADLKRQLAAKPAAAADDKTIAVAVQRALAARDKEIQAAAAEREKEVRQALTQRDRIIQDLSGRMGKAEKSLAGVLPLLQVNGDAKPSELAAPARNKIHASSQVSAAAHVASQPEREPVKAREKYSSPAATSDGTLSKGERTILTAIAQNPAGCTSEQITVLTGYKKTSKQEYLRQLKAKGLIEVDAAGSVRAMEGAESVLGDDFEPLPTGDELRQYWLKKLPAGEKTLLEVILDAYPESIDRATLEDSTGYKKTSTGEYLRCLRARKLVTDAGKGSVVASQNLFQ